MMILSIFPTPGFPINREAITHYSTWSETRSKRLKGCPQKYQLAKSSKMVSVVLAICYKSPKSRTLDPVEFVAPKVEEGRRLILGATNSKWS